VALHYNRSRDAAEALARRVNDDGGRAAAVHADLTREDQTGRLVARAADALGPVDCLINNAAAFERDNAGNVTRESWDLHMATNLRAPFVLMQTLASQLGAEATGNVISLIDTRVWNLTPHFVSYTVSKTALWTLTRTMAMALAPAIRVNAVGPGATLPSARQTDAQFARQTAATPLGRGTTPQEICDAVRFILAAPALTGQMIALDGGQHLGWAHPAPGVAPEE
jgi:NAD(P)-dependent dehydrogenase (short-subunit alcohol dehydrogenase family)